MSTVTKLNKIQARLDYLRSNNETLKEYPFEGECPHFDKPTDHERFLMCLLVSKEVFDSSKKNILKILRSSIETFY